MLRTVHPPRDRVRGFSLVELMVALAVGLIVIGAVLALVLSIMRANNQTIQATRLTQELRATAAVITSELKRSGGVDDPMTVATANNGDPLNPFGAVDSATAGCIRYAYANATGGNFHSISLNNSAIFLDTGATAADATCNGGVQLSSGAVAIDTLTFAVVGRRIDVTVQGSLVSDPAISRTFTQTVFIRSVAGS